MNIALILAGGLGSRIKTSKIPKQFLEINNKPIVAYTIDKFLFNRKIDFVVIACHEYWVNYLTTYLENNYQKFLNEYKVVKGGKNRNESIYNGVKFIKNAFPIRGDDLILTHDSVRVFVSDRIINENIKLCLKYNIVGTVVPTIDTILVSQKGEVVDNVLDRKYLYNVQTPQTFKFAIIDKLYSKNNIVDTTDAFKFLINFSSKKIGLVHGEYENFKITNDNDIKYIKNILSDSIK